MSTWNWLLLSHMIGMFFVALAIPCGSLKGFRFRFLYVFHIVKVILRYVVWEVALPYIVFRYLFSMYLHKKASKINPTYIDCDGEVVVYEEKSDDYSFQGYMCDKCQILVHDSQNGKHRILNPKLQKIYDSWFWKHYRYFYYDVPKY